MKPKSILKEKSILVTILMVVVIGILFLTAYLRIGKIIEARCLSRMEEGVNTVLEEVSSKLERDSLILNATASIISASDKFDVESLQETMNTVTPLLETMEIRVLMPDNTVIQPDGTVTDATGHISFREEAALGEHISDRMVSFLDGDTQVLRHYVPIIKDGEAAVILYGVTKLDELPTVLNVGNIYDASASVYIIDGKSGDFIMDTWHKTLGSMDGERKTKDGSSWEEQKKKMLSGETGYVIFRSESINDWMYLYYAPANINQWIIGVSIPEKQAFVSLRMIKTVCWWTAGIMAFAIILYCFWVYNNARAMVKKAVERVALEEKLAKAEAAERAKTTFLSNMSHDIRTPMNAVIGFATLAQTNIDKKDRVEEYLGKILSSGNHLLSLINDILDMSRIESGKLNIEEKECSISEIFRDMRNIIQTQMQEKQLEFFMDTLDVVDEDIYCDKLHLNQVLLNLLSNAIKFTPAGGSVSLLIRQKKSQKEGCAAYEIRVKDTGIGMSEEFSGFIFEPFERERNTTVSGIQGTGLGMAITKSIVDAMGGTIEMNTEQGKGTEFILQFNFRLQKEHQLPEVIPELEDMRVLVADDSFSACDSVTRMLRRIGMRAEWSMHGKEAVLRAAQSKEMGDEFKLYIIDWVLPDLSGVEVVRQIREKVGWDAPIIILTAYDWRSIEEEARSAGTTAFCSKPIFISELREVLIHAVKKTESVHTPQNETNVLPDEMEKLKGTRLLLVEDNELNREIAQEILKEHGFLVETAEDGTVAVNMVKQAAPGYYALILMDVQMPVMNGYDATKAIRAMDDPVRSSIPIVAMTANAFEEDRQHALESGMNDHVAKPINVAKLMDVIYSLLAKDETRTEDVPRP